MCVCVCVAVQAQLIKNSLVCYVIMQKGLILCSTPFKERFAVYYTVDIYTFLGGMVCGITREDTKSFFQGRHKKESSPRKEVECRHAFSS